MQPVEVAHFLGGVPRPGERHVVGLEDVRRDAAVCEKLILERRHAAGAGRPWPFIAVACRDRIADELDATRRCRASRHERALRLESEKLHLAQAGFRSASTSTRSWGPSERPEATSYVSRKGFVERTGERRAVDDDLKLAVALVLQVQRAARGVGDEAARRSRSRARRSGGDSSLRKVEAPDELDGGSRDRRGPSRPTGPWGASDEQEGRASAATRSPAASMLRALGSREKGSRAERRATSFPLTFMRKRRERRHKSVVMSGASPCAGPSRRWIHSTPSS